MEGLEIVNSNVRLLKKQLYKLKDVQEGTKEDFQKYTLECELKEQLKIKQDLEVLEIIYKKNVDVKNLRIYTKTFSHDKDLLSAYNVGLDEEYHLTMEELLKLKQWLEENKE